MQDVSSDPGLQGSAASTYAPFLEEQPSTGSRSTVRYEAEPSHMGGRQGVGVTKLRSFICEVSPTKVRIDTSKHVAGDELATFEMCQSPAVEH